MTNARVVFPGLARAGWLMAIAPLLCCGCSKKESSAAAPAVSAGPTARKCTDPKATLHENPPFCLVVPAGFVGTEKPWDDGTYVEYKSGAKDGPQVKYLKDSTRDRYDLKVNGMQTDAKEGERRSIVGQGETPGGKGKWLVYQDKYDEKYQRWAKAIARNNKRVFECSGTAWSDQDKDQEFLETCKTLEVLDE